MNRIIKNNTLFDNLYGTGGLYNECLSDVNKNQEMLQDVGYYVGKIGVIGDLPLTPTLSGYVDENLIIKPLQGLFHHLRSFGLYPVVYQGENDGRLVRNVVPRQGMEQKISSYGSKIAFLPHVDNPDLALRCEADVRTQISPCPDTLTLLCLRQQENVNTSIICLDDIIAQLSGSDIALLQEPYFKVSRPASFDNSLTIENLPVLAQYKGNYISRFDYHNVTSDSTVHQNALNHFKTACMNTSKWRAFHLKPGQFVTFDNQRTLHTQDGFNTKI